MHHYCWLSVPSLPPFNKGPNCDVVGCPGGGGTLVLWVSADVPPERPCFEKFCTHKDGVLEALKAPIRVGFSRFLHPQGRDFDNLLVQIQTFQDPCQCKMFRKQGPLRRTSYIPFTFGYCNVCAAQQGTILGIFCTPYTYRCAFSLKSTSDRCLTPKWIWVQVRKRVKEPTLIGAKFLTSESCQCKIGQKRYL